MKRLGYAGLYGILGIVVVWTMVLGFQCVYGQKSLFIDSYQCTLSDPDKQVYDGDTLKDVRVLLLERKFDADNLGEYWPGVHITKRGVEVETDIRISGIDTPEKRVSTKNADGTKRSEASRTRERNASYAARDELIRMIKRNNGKFSISNPEHGKYAGRTVANVFVGDKNVALWMISLGHAIFYDGGKKVPFDVWYKRDKKVQEINPKGKVSPKNPPKPPVGKGKASKINK